MLKSIYVARHGFRTSWQGSEIFSTTGRPRDPVLTAHGVDQAEELSAYFAALPDEEKPQLIISSPWYRCVQTSRPTAQKLGMRIVVEPGISEWFSTLPNTAGGQHPSPVRVATVISQFSPELVSDEWTPLLYPSRNGESAEELHARVRTVLRRIEERCLRMGIERVLICSHAATIIAIGRALMGEPPGEGGRGVHVGAGTCSLSKYVREGEGERWRQVMNGSADHLDKGVERDWSFDNVPTNVTEDGMGADWIDEEAPTEEELRKIEAAFQKSRI